MVITVLKETSKETNTKKILVKLYEKYVTQ